MAAIKPHELRHIRKVFNLDSGYVLDFSSSDFRHFVRASVGRDIYDPAYNNGSGSKAKRLQKFLEVEDDYTVGKLLLDLLNDTDYSGESAEICRSAAERLMRSPVKDQLDAAIPPLSSYRQPDSGKPDLSDLNSRFKELASSADRHLAGKEFEVLLFDLFKRYELEPRSNFRLRGEEIDGSFFFEGVTYLLEAKWQRNPISQRELLVFSGKIQGKAQTARGLFVAVSGITTEAADALTRGKAVPAFIVMTGEDLALAGC